MNDGSILTSTSTSISTSTPTNTNANTNTNTTINNTIRPIMIIPNSSELLNIRNALKKVLK